MMNKMKSTIRKKENVLNDQKSVSKKIYDETLRAYPLFMKRIVQRSKTSLRLRILTTNATLELEISMTPAQGILPIALIIYTFSL